MDRAHNLIIGPRVEQDIILDIKSNCKDFCVTALFKSSGLFDISLNVFYDTVGLASL